MSNIDVSFVTVNYNCFDVLRQSVTSIIENTLGIAFEHIIIDNNSSEGDIFEYLMDFSHLKIFKNIENIGWAAGINQAVRKSKGDYICIVDSDVILINNLGSELLEFCRTIDTNSIVGPRLLNRDMSIQNSISSFPSIRNKFFQAILFNRLLLKSKICNIDYFNYIVKDKGVYKVDQLVGACLFFSRKLFEDLRGLDQSYFFYWADTDLCWRIKKRNGVTYYNSNAQVIHLRGQSTSTTNYSGADFMAYDTLRFYRKNYSKLKRRIIYVFIILSLVNRALIYFFLYLTQINRKLFSKVKYLINILSFFIRGIVKNESK